MTTGMQLLMFDFAPARQSSRKAVQTSGGWSVADHACRRCGGGRVLVKRRGTRVVAARCAECGASGEGGHESICCCGAAFGVAGKLLECYRNPSVSPAVPYEVMVRERVTEVIDEPVRKSRPVGIKEY